MSGAAQVMRKLNEKDIEYTAERFMSGFHGIRIMFKSKRDAALAERHVGFPYKGGPRTPIGCYFMEFYL